MADAFGRRLWIYSLKACYLDSLALTLILTSAFAHAYWNMLTKRAGGGAVFVWLFSMVSLVVLIPLAIGLFVLQRPTITPLGFGFMCGTALLHLLYFLVLQRAYRTGDLSLVYPLARGIGPTLATVSAVILLAEEPSMLALTGLVLVIMGVFLLTLRQSPEHAKHPREAILFGVLCGICIATYSVWDKYAVAELAVPPLLLEVFSSLGIAVMLTPHALRNRPIVKQQWQTKRFEVLGVAVLAPTSYILVLTAMRFTPLSLVAPSREISILIGAVLGARFLGEEHTARRLFAAALMVAGVIALAAG